MQRQSLLYSINLIVFLVSCFLVPVKIFSFYFYILCCVSSIVAVYQHIRSKKFSTVAPVFKNVGERSTAKSYRPGSLLFVVSKVIKKLVNNRLVDHLEEQYGFRSFRSTADLLTVVSDRITRDFNRSGVTQAVAFDIFIAYDMFWLAGLLHKRNSYMGFQVRYLVVFCLFLVIDDFEWFRMGSLHKNIQFMLESLKALFLVQRLSYYTIMTFLMILSAILLSMLMILPTTISVVKNLICDSSQNCLLSLHLIYNYWEIGQKRTC